MMVDRAQKGLIMANRSSLAKALGPTNYTEFIALREEIRKAYEPIQQFCIQNKRSFDHFMEEETYVSSEALMLGETLAVTVQKMTVFAATHTLAGVPLQLFREEMQKLGFGVLPFVRGAASDTFLLDDHMKALQETLSVFGQGLFGEHSASKKQAP